MTPKLLTADLPSLAAPVLAIFAVDTAANPAPRETEAAKQAAPVLLSDNEALLLSVSRFLNSGEFRAASGETLLLHAPAGMAADRLLIVGVGPNRKLDLAKLRQAAGTATRYVKSKGIRELAVALPEGSLLPSGLSAAEIARAMSEGAVLADFDSDIYRSGRTDTLMTGVSLVAAGTAQQIQIAEAVAEGTTIAESQNFARSLVLEPGNILPPTELGRRAAAMAQETGLACEVHSTAFLRDKQMNAFLAVAQGSAEPPALIVLRYEPEQTPAEGSPVLALVGKGITFDTGGISIKPADGMDKMKYDMAGAAAMLGTMRAVALLKPDVRVLCIVCSAENMPSGTAYKPGDVVTAMSGTTIEVMNTDAEGRMVLADGLHYARTLGATHLIDAATLTGACVVALGKLNAGLFSNDDAACSRFERAAETAGESFWRLPCTEDYRKLIESQIADIQNTGIDRWGGAITAAMFLKEFVADTPWIHLDIAGQAWIDEARSHIAKGPSGVGVRSILEWVRSYGIKPEV